MGIGQFLLVICLSLPPVSHPGELLPNPGTTDFSPRELLPNPGTTDSSPMSHKVGARVTTRILCCTCLHLISDVIYSASVRIGSYLYVPESIPGHEGFRPLLHKSAICMGNVGLSVFDLC